MGIAGIGLTQLLIIGLFSILPLFLLFRPIAKKAGYEGWLWPLLMLIPYLNIVLIWIFAFRKWPVENRNSQ